MHCQLGWKRIIPTNLLVFACLLTAVPRARADVHAGIEIGAKGVKATVVDITRSLEGNEVKVLLAKTANTTLTAGLGQTGRFDEQALKDTVLAVEQFFNQLRSEYKTPLERLYIVGSSGLFSSLAGKEDLIAANREALAAAIEKATGRKMDFLSDTREAELSIVGIVPRKHADTAFLIDIGSGNTKGGYKDRADERLATFSIPYGSVSLTDLAKRRAEKDGDSFDKAAAAIRDESVAPALKKQMETLTGLPMRKRVYLSGGAAWALATLARPAERGPYVELTAADVDRYRKMLAESKDAPSPDLSVIADEAVRAKVAAEVRRVQQTFSRQNLVAGAEVLKALSDELAGGEAGRKFYFARHGYLGWILAYVEEKAAAKQ